MKATITFLVLAMTTSSVFAKGRPLLRCPKQGNKVIICHVPPGNPDKAKEITINKNSVQDHLNHGDYAGYCENTQYADKKEMCGICDVDIDPTCS